MAALVVPLFGSATVAQSEGRGIRGASRPSIESGTRNRHTVMPGLVPGIHGLFATVGATWNAGNRLVDGRDKHGHDEGGNCHPCELSNRTAVRQARA
jgi:hypothetical protein